MSCKTLIVSIVSIFFLGRGTNRSNIVSYTSDYFVCWVNNVYITYHIYYYCCWCYGNYWLWLLFWTNRYQNYFSAEGPSSVQKSMTCETNFIQGWVIWIPFPKKKKKKNFNKIVFFFFLFCLFFFFVWMFGLNILLFIFPRFENWKLKIENMWCCSCALITFLPLPTHLYVYYVTFNALSFHLLYIIPQIHAIVIYLFFYFRRFMQLLLFLIIAINFSDLFCLCFTYFIITYVDLYILLFYYCINIHIAQNN